MIQEGVYGGKTTCLATINTPHLLRKRCCQDSSSRSPPAAGSPSHSNLSPFLSFRSPDGANAEEQGHRISSGAAQGQTGQTSHAIARTSKGRDGREQVECLKECKNLLQTQTQSSPAVNGAFPTSHCRRPGAAEKVSKSKNLGTDAWPSLGSLLWESQRY